MDSLSMAFTAINPINGMLSWYLEALEIYSLAFLLMLSWLRPGARQETRHAANSFMVHPLPRRTKSIL